MKALKTSLIYGSVAGAIMISSWFLMNGLFSDPDGTPNFDRGEFIGYAAMILALSAVFIGVKRYRDKDLDGNISFREAFVAGLYIVLVTSVIYVCSWMIYYPNFIPDFTDKYAAYEIQKYVEAGVSGQELEVKKAEIRSAMETYKKPAVMMAYTFMEVFPVGLIVAAISALILRKKKINT